MPDRGVWCCRTLDGRGGPDASDGHVDFPFTHEIHCQALCQDTHADFSHGIRGLPAEEAGVDRWADDYDASFPVLGLEMWKGSLNGPVQTLGNWSDLLAY